MRFNRDAGAGGFRGVFSLSDPSGSFLGERRGDGGSLDGVEGEATAKLSFVGATGGKMFGQRVVAVLDGRLGEVASGATFGVDGAKAKGFEPCEVSVESDALSSLTAMPDEELQVNGGLSLGTGTWVFPEVASSSASEGGNSVGMTETHILDITAEGHPAFGTGTSAYVKSQWPLKAATMACSLSSRRVKPDFNTGPRILRTRSMGRATAGTL